ncbi:xylose isomerase-like protein [Scleroderma yunnanense]
MVQTRRATRAARQHHGSSSSNELNSALTGKPTEPAALEATDGRSRPKKRRRTTSEDNGSLMEAFPMRVNSPWKVGAHVSAAGGVENAVLNAARIGANAFALFVKSQRKWTSPALTEGNITSFKARMKQFGYLPDHVLVHGSYLTNLGNPVDEKREKSYECFLDDIQRCEQLGLQLYNFHPGSTVGRTTKEHSIALIGECINRAHRATSSITIVVENMAGAGNVIGSEFSESRAIIDHVQNKDRVAICLDTCHLYAAGYDISTKAGWDATLAEFDKIVGLSYLRGLHLNDARTTLGSKKDRHENIGLGPLALGFHAILTDPRTRDLPLVLETPTHGTDMDMDGVWASEISVLYRMAGLKDESCKVDRSVDGTDMGKDRENDEAEADVMKTLLDEMSSVVVAAKRKNDAGAKVPSKRYRPTRFPR